MFIKKASLYALSLVAIFLMGMSVLGQTQTTGALRGTVVDAKGDVVAGATVTVKNEATGIETTTTTSGEGLFEVAQLLPGVYTTTVESSGFKRSVKTGIQVSIGQVTSSNMALETGQISETITVVATGEESLQTEQAQITGTVDTRRIEELPSNGAGGGIDTLALLIPGVVQSRASGSNNNGAALSVNGNRARSNNFQIDGQDNNDLTVGGPALFVNNPDTVQEFQVVTSNFSAQYGRNQGAIVNVVSKSGTNEFHGTAFLFHQDAYNLNALNNIEKRSGQLKPDRSLYNVFGGTFGGPIVLPNFGENDGPIAHMLKNKAFFFFGYQGIRNPATFVARSTAYQILPSDHTRLLATYPTSGAVNTIVNFSPFNLGSTINTFSTAGNGQPVIQTKFNFANPAGCPRFLAVSAAVPAGCGTYTTYNNPATGQPFLTGGPYDVYNFGTNAAPDLYQAANYEHQYDVTVFENSWQYRFDVRPTDRDNVNFRYINQRQTNRNAGEFLSNGWHGDLPVFSRNIGGEWSRQITGRLVNTFRASTTKIGLVFGGGCEARTPGCVPDATDIGLTLANVAFTGFTSQRALTSLGTIGPQTSRPQGRIGKVHQFADMVNWAKGNHSWIFGYEFKRLTNLVPFLPNYNGSYTFNSASRVRNNAPSALSLAVGEALLAFQENDHYFFAQDDWKIRPNLTLNLGVRYEYTGQPVNLLHELSLARESSSKPLYNPNVPIEFRTTRKYATDKNNWAPRVGFAWVPKFWKSVFGEDATVVRGGYSIAYEPAFYNIMLNMSTNAPFAASLTVPTASLTDTPGSIYALPVNPYGDTVRAQAASTGLLPLGQLDPRYLAQVDLDPNFYAPYSQQFSLGVQRQIGRNYMVESRYVGTKGSGLFQQVNGNFYVGPFLNGFTRSGIFFPDFKQFVPAGTTAQVCTNTPGTLADESACNNRLYPFAGITRRNNGGSSIYHSLQNRFSGRFLNNSLNLGATYTWSKSLDNVSEIFAYVDATSPNAQNPFCTTSCERGLSAFDRPHVFTVNWLYDVPFMKEQRGILGRILGGWQINGVYYLTSGQPFTPQNGLTTALNSNYVTAGDRPFAGNPNADRGTVAISQLDALLSFGIPCGAAGCAVGQSAFWSVNSLNSATGTPVAVTPNDVRFIINGPGAARIFGTPFGSLGRNTERGPKFNHMNLSVFKNIRIAERFRMQLRGEAFNVLNHPNPGVGTGQGNSTPQTSLVNAGFAGNEFYNFQDITYGARVVQVGLRLIF